MLEISLLDHQTQGKSHISAHKHDFFLFFLIEEGDGTHTIDFEKHQVGNKQLHILLPEQVHEWELAETTKGVQLMISKDVFATFVNYLDFSSLVHFHYPVLSLDDIAFSSIKEQFSFLDRELKNENLAWNIIYTNTVLITQLIARELDKSFEDFTQMKSNPTMVKYESFA